MSPVSKTKPAPPRGESYVWLTAMGLGIGVTLVVGLLALIIFNGVPVFWPKRIVEFTLKDGSVVAGEITREQATADGRRELQIHMANKDVYGISYRFIPEDTIASRSEPENYMFADRMGNGSAIFKPVALEMKAGGTLSATAPEFEGKLQELVKGAAKLRRQIGHIEKTRIGSINRKMSANDLQLQCLVRNQALDESSRTVKEQALKDSTTALQTEYDALAAESKELQARLADNVLRYKLAGDEERSQIVGDLVKVYYPNRLGFGGRIAVFFSHIWSFLSEDPRESNTEGGIFPAIFGTFVMTLLMSLLVTPFGVIAAIYLREYARQGLLVRVVRISVNNLAGVPSIVFGVFGVGFFVYLVGASVDRHFFPDLAAPTFGTGGIFWASLTLALLTLPVIIVATEEALAAVPRGLREASLACGASKWQMIQRVVLPSAIPGILTGVVLAMARGAGEVAPLMIVGVVKWAPTLPIDAIPPFIHLDQKFMHLGFHIFDLGFQSPDSDAAKPMVFATALLLIMLVIVMNLTAILMRNHLRKKYAIGTF